MEIIKSMANIPNNYPGGCTDKQILFVIDELSNEIIISGGDINVVLRLSPIITLGQSELQKRILESSRLITNDLHVEVKKLSEVADKNTRSSEKYAKASKAISLVALFLSIVSIGISIYLSIRSDRNDNYWKRDEINLLQKMLDK
jgi:hypothetical protein